MNSYKDQNSNLETQQNKQKSENFIREIKNNKKDKSNNKKNQSIESIKTRALSSESEDFISKYLFDSNLKNDNTDNNKKNINKDINNENLKKNNNRNKNCLEIKNKKSTNIKEYDLYKLYKNSLNSSFKVPKLPLIYDTEFRINNNSNQDKIGEKEFIKNNISNEYNKNEEYKTISKFPNDKLSHMCISENFYYNKKKKNYNKISVTQRCKHKYLTMVYFFP
jgi:hypothetical protein